MSDETKKPIAYPYEVWAAKAPSEVVCELNRLANANSEREHHGSLAYIALSAKYDAAVEACKLARPILEEDREILVSSETINGDTETMNAGAKRLLANYDGAIAACNEAIAKAGARC